MPVRITQGIMYARALSDVQRGLFRYSQLQQQVATGRRVNAPSDDPAAALRILPLRGDQRNLEQLEQNVSLARETLDVAAASLEDASAAMQRVRELVTQASNGTISAGDRASIAAEVDQLLGQMVGIANSRRGERYLFGGTENSVEPFELTTIGARTRPVYNGNRDSLEIDVAPGTRTALNIPGESIFMGRDRTTTTFSPAYGSAATGAAPVGVGDTAVGFGQLEVTFAGLASDAPAEFSAGAGATTALGVLDYSFSGGALSVGGGPAIAIPATDQTFQTADGREITLTVTGAPTPASGTFTSMANLSIDGGQSFRQIDDFVDQSWPVVDAEDGSVLYVNSLEIARTGVEEVRYGGTFDVFTTLSELRDLLNNDAGLPDGEVRDRVASLIPEVDAAHDSILDGLRELGFRSSSMDVLQNRVQGLRIANAESLSRIEDTDIAESILELQRQDLSYQTALQVSARVLQTSLQGFLR